MAADKIGKISMLSDLNENLYLGLFWSEKLIGNDENCFENGGLVKMNLNANFIITNQFLTSKYSYISIFIEIGDH
jgi:hypothetical protein